MGMKFPNKNDEQGMNFGERDYALNEDLTNATSQLDTIQKTTPVLTGESGESGEFTFTDDFNRTNNTQLGAPWYNILGSMGITSNKCVPNLASGGTTRTDRDDKMKDFIAEYDMTYNGGNDNPAFVYRTDGTNNNRMLFYFGTSNDLNLRRVIGNVGTILATESYTLPIGVSIHIKIHINDDNHKIYIDDNLIIDYTDINALATNTSIGIQTYKDGGVGSTTFDNFSISGYVEDLGDSWTSIDLLAFGDSITYEHLYLDTILNRLNFATYTNRGINSQSITDGLIGSAPVSGIESVMLEDLFHLRKICTMAWGANDFRFDAPLGSLGVIGDTSFDIATFYGAYRKSIEVALTQNPKIKIYLLTPMQRNKDGYDVNFVNGAGLKLVDYVDAIINIANLYGMPFVDLYRTSGFVGSATFVGTLPTFTRDGLHPNELGGTRQGDVVARTIYTNGVGEILT